MKKLICILLLAALLITMFAGCMGSFECDLCGEEKTGKQYTGDLFGQKVVFCKDCKEGLEALSDLFG